MTVIVKKGERITTASGEHFATANRDIKVGEPFPSDAVDLPDGTHPTPGEIIPPEIVVVEDGMGVGLYVEGEPRKFRP